MILRYLSFSVLAFLLIGCGSAKIVTVEKRVPVKYELGGPKLNTPEMSVKVWRGKGSKVMLEKSDFLKIHRNYRELKLHYNHLYDGVSEFNKIEGEK